jgi:ATP-dependent Clp protease ATP-binding subunit ClpC
MVTEPNHENCEHLSEEAYFNPDCTPQYVTGHQNLSANEKSHLLLLESNLKKRIIGQDAAIAAVCKCLRRNAVGLREPNRPVGNFMFAGPSGVGKTELCKAISDTLFGPNARMIRLDMSEYMAQHSYVSLVGASRGYVGYEDGGYLTNLVLQNPKAVLCIDEIEKAHEDVFSIFLQILSDGILTSTRGEAVSFRDIIVIFTSNIGAEQVASNSQPIGFDKNSDIAGNKNRKIYEAMKSTFKPEFLNRIDDTIYFNTLTTQDVLAICRLQLARIKQRAKQIGLGVDFDKSAIRELARRGYNTAYGARELKRVLADNIETMLADKFLTDELKFGDNIRIYYSADSFVAKPAKAKQALSPKDGLCSSDERIMTTTKAVRAAKGAKL